ncbi:MAG: TIGR03668 family PPOX class F420-dependent oxidoreductase, partial [Candidatus Geothermarchaeales archaeon]
ARLATADGRGRPYLVPICYVYLPGTLYTAIDTKPKTVRPSKLRRLRNIGENPWVSVLVDRYDEDWSRLAYVLVLGRAEVVRDEEERDEAKALLRDKYPQYNSTEITREVVKIVPERIIHWGYLH